MATIVRRGAALHRLLLGAVLTFGLLLGIALPAAAHDSLVSSTPAQAESVTRTPSEVVLTLSEPAVAMGTQIVVTGPSGPVQQGAPRLANRTVSQTLQPGAPAGDYTVTWRVTSSDGHPISGSFTFGSEAAGAGTPPTRADPVPLSPTPRSPWVWWVAAAVVLAGAGAVLGLRRQRRLRPVG